ncbi:PqqD family peptide modification chaperone [Paracoccus sp. M683]|uniref:PqqD family peptide modification chaperone n=1 Tax=Paracoccus sp. M683 TaxID=2594268 RepID=UPI00117C89CA|nr:PqqD family peptide modification chaperone [Paracoccus sp. M683]TRW96255.1 PqqD family peptide modification chaperone [Paracoccus sp. M683]
MQAKPQTDEQGAVPGGAPHPRLRLRLRWQGTDAPVLIPDDPALIGGLAATQGGWPATACPDPISMPELALVKTGPRGSYALWSRHLDQPLEGLGLAGTICAINADLIESYLSCRPDLSGLHAGGAVIGGRLIALTGEAGSGKSTLIARLSAEPDIAIFCDDILPVAPDGTAIALGLATRLRLPLPPRASARLVDHVARYRGPADADYSYLAPPNQVPHGAMAPLRAVIALDRSDDDGPARLEWLDPGSMTRLMLLQNVAVNRSSAEAMARAQTLAAAGPALRLVYSDLEDAVSLLRRAFGGERMLPEGLPVGPARQLVQQPLVREIPVDPARSWQRIEGTILHQRGSAGFLARKDGATIWTLDRTALAVWMMLEHPGSAAGMAEILAEIFPDQPRRRLARDIARLLAGLWAEGLIRPALPSGPGRP